jgi:Ca2+-binding RTX toxin-like protein
MRRLVSVVFVVALLMTGVVAAAGGAPPDAMTKVDEWNGWDPPNVMAGTTDVAMDAAGNVYVPNEGEGAVRVFDGHGNYLRSFTGVAAPHGLAVDDANNRLYVAAFGDNVVEVYDLKTGAKVRSWGSWDENGTTKSFVQPLYLDVDSNGDVYVSEEGTGLLRRFKPNGKWVKTFDTGAAANDVDVSINPATGVEEVVVAVPFEHSIKVFKRNGAFIRAWGSEGTGDGQFEWVRGVAAHGDLIYAADQDLKRVTSFDRNGKYRAHTTDTKLQRLDGIAADGYGNVYTADQFSSWIMRFVEWGAAPKCGGLTPTLLGTLGDEKLKGTGADNVIVGLDGRDTILAGGGNDVACGGDGADRIEGSNGQDRLYGDAGKDKLFGQGGKDKLYGGSQRDVIFGGNKNDKLFGQFGDDKLIGGGGTDTVVGGGGTDVCAGETLKSCEA